MSKMRQASAVEKALVAIQGKVLVQSGAYVTDENGAKVAQMMESPALSEAHKRRIVAAVNACAGISLEDLRALGVGGLATVLDRVRGGSRDEGAGGTAVSVIEESASEAPTKTVHVVAWHYTGGAGFDWYANAVDAEQAFEAEKFNCSEMRDCLWTAYAFEVEVSATLLAEEVTKVIDDDLDERCATATRRFSVGSGMALAV